MLHKPDSCKLCPLYGKGLGFINPEGLGSNGITLIGEAGGEYESKYGRPFIKFAASGSKLEEVFKLVNQPRNLFRIGNVINCQPPNNKLEYMPYEYDAIGHCKQHMRRAFARENDNVIIAFGKIAMRELTKWSGEGKYENISILQGYPVETGDGIVIPSFHPSFVKRGKPQYTYYLVQVINRALEIARSGWPKIDYPFLAHASYQDIKDFYFKVKANADSPLYYDIETDETLDSEEDERQGLKSNTITRIQFYSPNCRSISFPWNEEFLKLVRLLFLLPNRKYGFNNWNFDDIRIKDKGLAINGTIVDVMWMFKHWQPGLLRGLQSVAQNFSYPEPWKHLGNTDIDLYGHHDVYSLDWIVPKLKARMIEDGVYGGFEKHCIEFWPILSNAKSDGLPVDKEKISNLEIKLRSERERINTEIQSFIPDSLRNILPKRRTESGIELGYARAPKKLICQEYQEAKTNGKKQKRYCLRYSVVRTSDGSYKTKWFKSLDFVPSSKQLLSYIDYQHKTLSESSSVHEKRKAKYYIAPLTFDIKTKQLRKTTGKKALESILSNTGDEVIRRVIGDKDIDGQIGEKAGIRSIDKMITNDIKNWQPASDGRVHTTWGMTAASGQLDSREPNILNCSKHTELGLIFREIIEAPQGHILVECDKKSYHVATMGYCANDPEYIRFSQLDPHSFFTAHMDEGKTYGLPTFKMSDQEILSICKKYKSDEKHGWIRQHIGKIIVLGNQLGLGKRKIYINQNYLVTDPITKKKTRPFQSMQQIGDLQKLIATLFPKVEVFKRNIRQEAHKTKSLKNEWGYLQRFWEVFAWKFDDEMQQLTLKPGTESEKAIAFPVQSLAFGDLRDKLLQLQEKGLLETYRFINSIHDSVMFCFPKNLLDNFITDVYPILVSPSRRLIKSCCPEGLIVGVDVSYGRNWGKYDLVKNPEGMKELKNVEM